MPYLNICKPLVASDRADKRAINCVDSAPPGSQAVHGREQSDSDMHASRIATVKQVLRTTVEHLQRSDSLLAGMQDSISMTLQILQASQQRINSSDLAIARTKTLDCE